MQADQIIFLTLSLYLIGFVVFILLRKKISEKWVNSLSLPVNIVGFILSLLLIINLGEDQVYNFPWVHLGETDFNVSILVNRLTVLMVTLVQFIALLVQLFSTKYMRGEGRYTLYYAYINLFVFSMLGLVVSGNLLFIFLFWELVGFCSYLLIGFWFEKASANQASLKAFLMNRIGDAGFLIGIGLVMYQFGTLELTDLSSQASVIPTTLLTYTGLALFCGCIGKSAQFPLQTWLPDAMEGPTPVSALIHAATMVAAGIFLLARINFLITPDAGIVIAAIGAFTSLLAAYSAIFQFDIKKVLAYSTVSQLGLMVMAMGAGAVNAALFHLFTHAFFKAGLFLIAGAIIHHLHHEQDMRKMGGLLNTKPWLAIAYLICGAALAGMPFTSGYLSKHALVLSAQDWAINQNQPALLLIPFMGFVASVMTAVYVTRLFVMVFLGGPKINVRWSKPDLLEWSIFPLVIASFWTLHSLSPWSLGYSFFTRWFVIAFSENHFIGYGMLALALLAVFVTVRMFLKQQISLGTQKIWQKLGFYHYGIDELYTHKIAPFFVGKNLKHPSDTVNMEDKNEGGLAVIINTIDEKVLDKSVNMVGRSERSFSQLLFWMDQYIVDGLTELLRKGILFFGKAGAFLDGKFVDAIINGISFYISKIGDRLKGIQGGKVQSYLMALVLILIALFLILNLL